MTKAQELQESRAGTIDSIFQEYRDKLNQALEQESNELKEKAEQDSSRIINSAQEEAAEILAEAKKEARAEAIKIISEANKEADKIVRDSIEKATSARQESARVAAEIKRLIDSIAESQAILQVTNETPKKEAEVVSPPAVEVEAVTEAAVIEKTETAVVPSAADKRGPPPKDGDDAKLFKGRLNLEVVPPFNHEHTGGVPERLGRISGLEIISTGGYARANRRIVTYAISLQQPTPLLKFLKALPSVKDVAEHKGTIVTTLK